MKNSQLRQDLPISINYRVILPFPEGFIFTKLRICEVSRNEVLAKISEFIVYFLSMRHNMGLVLKKKHGIAASNNKGAGYPLYLAV